MRRARVLRPLWSVPASLCGLQEFCLCKPLRPTRVLPLRRARAPRQASRTASAACQSSTPTVPASPPASTVRAGSGLAACVLASLCGLQELCLCGTHWLRLQPIRSIRFSLISTHGDRIDRNHSVLHRLGHPDPPLRRARIMCLSFRRPRLPQRYVRVPGLPRASSQASAACKSSASAARTSSAPSVPAHLCGVPEFYAHVP